eukprot:403372047
MNEFNGIIDACSQITAKVYSHNRKKDVEGINQGVIIALGLSTVLLLCFFFLMYYGIKDDDQRARIAGYYSLAISVFITKVIGVANFFSRPEQYTSYNEMVSKTLLSFFQRLNKKYEVLGIEFDEKGIHYWIELKVNKKKRDQWRRNKGYDLNTQDQDEEEFLKNNGNNVIKQQVIIKQNKVDDQIQNNQNAFDMFDVVEEEDQQNISDGSFQSAYNEYEYTTLVKNENQTCNF